MFCSLSEGFSPRERNALIRYAITIGERMSCATYELLHPLDINELEIAFKEKEDELKENIEKNRKKLAARGYTEDESDFTENAIEADIETLNAIRRDYTITVKFFNIPDELIAFHKSLNPCTTFEFMDYLHEKCEFALTDELRRKFLNSSLKNPPVGKEDTDKDFGCVYFGEEPNELCYANIEVNIGERLILETFAEWNMCNIDFTEEELADFENFDGKQKANLLTIKKIKQKMRTKGDISSF